MAISHLNASAEPRTLQDVAQDLAATPLTLGQLRNLSEEYKSLGGLPSRARALVHAIADLPLVTADPTNDSIAIGRALQLKILDQMGEERVLPFLLREFELKFEEVRAVGGPEKEDGSREVYDLIQSAGQEIDTAIFIAWRLPPQQRDAFMRNVSLLFLQKLQFSKIDSVLLRTIKRFSFRYNHRNNRFHYYFFNDQRTLDQLARHLGSIDASIANAAIDAIIKIGNGNQLVALFKTLQLSGDALENAQIKLLHAILTSHSSGFSNNRFLPSLDGQLKAMRVKASSLNPRLNELVELALDILKRQNAPARPVAELLAEIEQIEIFLKESRTRECEDKLEDLSPVYFYVVMP